MGKISSLGAYSEPREVHGGYLARYMSSTSEGTRMVPREVEFWNQRSVGFLSARPRRVQAFTKLSE